MQDRNHAQAVALLGGIVAVVLSLPGMAEWVLPAGWERGIGAGAGLSARLLHPLVHVGMLHALVNVYVLWQLVFLCRIRLGQLLWAWMVASTCPVAVALWPWSWLHGAIAPPGVIGLSGVLFVLLGMVMPRSSRPMRFCGQLLLWQVPGMVWGTVAVGMHLYCMVWGVVTCLAVRLWHVIARHCR